MPILSTVTVGISMEFFDERTAYMLQYITFPEGRHYKPHFSAERFV
jgi:hypothetical protein